MQFIFTPEPSNAVQLIQAAVARLISLPHHSADPVLKRRTIKIKTSNASYSPIPVYNFSLSDVLDGCSLEYSRTVGFYFVLEIAEIAAGRAYILTDDAGCASSVANISFGSYAKNVLRVLDDLAIDDQINSDIYALRALRCPGLYLDALWLKRISGGADLIYPLERSPNPFKTLRDPPYTVNEFIESMQPFAYARINASRAMIKRGL